MPVSLIEDIFAAIDDGIPIDQAIFFEVFELWLSAAYDANKTPASWFVAVCVVCDETSLT